MIFSQIIDWVQLFKQSLSVVSFNKKLKEIQRLINNNFCLLSLTYIKNQLLKYYLKYAQDIISLQIFHNSYERIREGILFFLKSLVGCHFAQDSRIRQDLSSERGYPVD